MSEFVNANVKSSQTAAAPLLGEEAEKVLSRVDTSSRNTVQEESLRILSRCNSQDPDSPAHAQLVVGEVQSGKTLSFTTVMALARDNGYPLIVVLAGTKNNLLDQTEKRLKTDLGMTENAGLPAWRTWTNPDESDANELASVLQPWSDSSIPPEFRQTAILFVLKHAGRLDSVTATLKSVFQTNGLQEVAALIVDDEADQASLNLKARRGEQSSVYAALLRLRSSLKRHTYLMYTATPQAPLLVDIADALSPDSVTMLTAGENYVGGEELFDDPNSAYVREIDSTDLLIALDPTSPNPPESLSDAVAFWTLALVVAHEQRYPHPITMLVHPASTRDLHTAYNKWIEAILSGWRTALADPADIAYEDLALGVFKRAYNEMRRTRPSLPDFDADRSEFDRMLQKSRLLLGTTKQIVVNSATALDIPEEDWRQYTGWIVIGGNKLDRGFTVKNLAVTYMPRGPGVGNADTIQQRGRFFGYKRDFIDLLRGWFSTDLASIFKSYVEHEKTMQKYLSDLDENSLSLKTWRRKFLLDPNLRPTRKQIITLSTSDSVVGRDWAFRQVDLFEPPSTIDNTDALTVLAKTLAADGVTHPGDDRSGTSVNRHLIAGLDYSSMADILAGWECSLREREELDKVLFVIQGAKDDNVEPPIMLIGINGLIGSRDRSRSGSSGRITNLFQGRGSTDNYKGDAAFRDESAITIQLHKVTPVESDKSRGLVVPALAVALPTSWERRVYWELSK